MFARTRVTTLTPLKAIRKHCVSCVGSPYEVAKCGGDKMLGGQGDKNNICYFFPYRLGKGRPSVKTIRKFCLECMGGDKARRQQTKEVLEGVENCPSLDCTLHLFRLGTNPNRSGVGGSK